MELWDPLGRTTSGFLMGLKILFARVCKTVSDSELDTPIASKDKELATEVALFLNNLVNIDLVVPFPRALVPFKHRVSAICSAKDGSPFGYSASAHIITQLEGKKSSALIRTMCNLHISSVPRNEAIGWVLLARLIEDILNVTFREFLVEEQKELPIFFAGDNLPVSWGWITE